MFAIVEISGKQYKVSEDDTIEVDKLGTAKGKIKFDKVLLYAKDDKNVELGRPYIKDAYVEAEVVDEKRGDKVKVFKMKPKKRYSKTIGHRKHLTVVQIKGIKVSAKSGAKSSKKSSSKSTEKSTKKSPAKSGAKSA
jgi:large subunit ribosomal protein L21